MQPATHPFVNFTPIQVKVDIPEKGATVFTVQRPDAERVLATHHIAKQIFVEAFETSYTRYYQQSKETAPIEQWLQLKPGLSFRAWLEATFDDEYQEYKEGKKGFIYLCDSENKLVGWLSHDPVDAQGDLYLSQCSLEAGWRNQKVSTTAFAEVLNNDVLFTMFPNAKELKLIVRKVNEVARKLYDNAQFTYDKTIDPKVYGASYDARYVGYRRRLRD